MWIERFCCMVSDQSFNRTGKFTVLASSCPPSATCDSSVYYNLLLSDITRLIRHEKQRSICYVPCIVHPAHGDLIIPRFPKALIISTISSSHTLRIGRVHQSRHDGIQSHSFIRIHDSSRFYKLKNRRCDCPIFTRRMSTQPCLARHASTSALVEAKSVDLLV